MAGIIVLPSGDSIPHTNVAPKLTVGLCIVYEAPFKHLQKQPVFWNLNSETLEVALLLLQ